MRLAGGGAVSVEYSERKRREARQGRERERESARKRERSSQAEKELALHWLVALHNTRWSSLECRAWCWGDLLYHQGQHSLQTRLQ